MLCTCPCLLYYYCFWFPQSCFEKIHDLLASVYTAVKPTIFRNFPSSRSESAMLSAESQFECILDWMWHLDTNFSKFFHIFSDRILIVISHNSVACLIRICPKIPVKLTSSRHALGPYRLSKLRMAALLAPFSVGMGPFGTSGSSKFQYRSQISSPFLGLASPFWEEVKKNQCVSIRKKTYKSRSGLTKNTCCLILLVSRSCFSDREKAHRKNVLFFSEISITLIFALCFLPSAARSSSLQKKSQRAHFQGFWDFLAHFEAQGARNFGSGYVSQNSRVLPRVVCLGVCGECNGVK